MRSPLKDQPQEGLRARKRRLTRERIGEAAMALFLSRGFEATTIDDIAIAAEVSKRTFFDYFPSKEDVVFAWQDAFGQAVADAIASRPKDEPMAKAVEAALLASLAAVSTPRAMAGHRVVKSTPALHARNQTKYSRLEQTLIEALTAREGLTEATLRIRMLAIAVVGCMRLGGEAWRAEGRRENVETHARRFMTAVWSELAELSREALAD